MPKHTGSRQKFFIERTILPEGLIKAKNQIFWDPQGRLIPLAGVTVKMENPLNHEGPYFVVYDSHDFMITRVRRLENEDKPEVGRQMDRFLRRGNSATPTKDNERTNADGG